MGEILEEITMVVCKKCGTAFHFREDAVRHVNSLEQVPPPKLNVGDRFKMYTHSYAEYVSEVSKTIVEAEVKSFQLNSTHSPQYQLIQRKVISGQGSGGGSFTYIGDVGDELYSEKKLLPLIIKKLT